VRAARHAFALALASAAASAAVALPACKDDGTAPATSNARTCTLTLGGNVEAPPAPAGACATLAPSMDGTSLVLGIDTSTTALGRLQATIAIGPNAQPGTFSSTTSSFDWSATALLDADASCSYAAGLTAVPAGSYSLVLDAVDAAEDASSGAPHGTLDLVLFVHAPPATACGQHDTENVRVTF
jgi:hypothetical protein